MISIERRFSCQSSTSRSKSLGKVNISVLTFVVLATISSVATINVGLAQAQSTDIPQQSQDLNQTVAAMLASNPNGGDALAKAVHDLVLANPAAVNAIIAAVKANGNDAQQTAVGQGFGQAAQDAVKANNRDLAVAIQAAVAASGMPLAVAAFTTAAGDTTIAAISNAGGQQGGTGGGWGAGTDPIIPHNLSVEGIQFDATVTKAVSNLQVQHLGFGLYGYLLINSRDVSTELQCSALSAFLNTNDFENMSAQDIPYEKRKKTHLFSVPVNEFDSEKRYSAETLRLNYDFAGANSLLRTMYVRGNGMLTTKFDPNPVGIFLAFREAEPLTPNNALADRIVDLSALRPLQVKMLISVIRGELKQRDWKAITFPHRLIRGLEDLNVVTTFMERVIKVSSRVGIIDEKTPKPEVATCSDTALRLIASDASEHEQNRQQIFEKDNSRVKKQKIRTGSSRDKN